MLTGTLISLKKSTGVRICVTQWTEVHNVFTFRLATVILSLADARATESVYG